MYLVYVAPKISTAHHERDLLELSKRVKNIVFLVGSPSDVFERIESPKTVYYNNKLSNIRTFVRVLKWSPVLIWIYYQAVKKSELKFNKGSSIKKGLRRIFKSLNLAYTIKSEVENLLLNDYKGSIIVYNYWSFEIEYSGWLKMMRLPVTIISRAHGGDLYNSREYFKVNTIFRSFQLYGIDKMIAISKDGYNHLSREYPKYKEKFDWLYLGSKEVLSSFQHLSRESKQPELFHKILNNDKIKNCDRTKNLIIVTCSFNVQVKRLDRLIDALTLADFPVIWCHIGGLEFKSTENFNYINSFKEKKATLLKNELVHLIDLGKVENEYVTALYNYVKPDVFVNTSDSEGIPVAIMEAFSCGIPAIAYDVGGNKEIIESEKNGFLLSHKSTPDALWDVFNKIQFLKLKGELSTLQEYCRKTWENKFDISNNYDLFVDKYLN